jgi:hypothetical protein
VAVAVAPLAQRLPAEPVLIPVVRVTVAVAVLGGLPAVVPADAVEISMVSLVVMAALRVRVAVAMVAVLPPDRVTVTLE